MNYDVVKAEYVDGYQLRLTFADGACGMVDFLPFIEKGGVFAVLRNREVFKTFAVNADWNTVTWQNGQLDIAPETLYFEATGHWPAREWMLHVAESSAEYKTDADTE